MRSELGGGAANRVYAGAYLAGESTLPDNVWDRRSTKSEGTHWNKKVLKKMQVEHPLRNPLPLQLKVMIE